MAVIAGAMTITTDAYAQTNTERLATVDARTAETHDLVTGLVESLGFLTGTVTDLHGMVTSVFESVTQVKDAVDSTSMKVDALDSKISMVAGDIDANSAQLAELASSVSSDISDVSDAVAANGAAIRDLNSNVQTSIDNAVGDLSAKVDTNAAAITEIQNALSGINTQLEEISTNLGVVQENVDVPVVSAFPLALTEETIDERNAVYLADFFKNTSKQDEDDKYSYSFGFSCEQDVVVQKVTIENTKGGINTNGELLTADNGVNRISDPATRSDALVAVNATAINADAPSRVNGAENPFHIRVGTTDQVDAEVRVNGQAALDNDYSLGGTTEVGSLRALSYGSSLLQLTAGSTVTFTAEADFTSFISSLEASTTSAPQDRQATPSQADEDAMADIYMALTQPDNDTHYNMNNARLFTVVIQYIQSGDAECSVSLDQAGDYDYKDTVTIQLSPEVSDALTSSFETTVSCNDVPTRFTTQDSQIFVAYRGENADNAPTYIDVTLAGGNKVVNLGSSTGTPSTLMVSSDTTDRLPIEMDSGTLKISGTTLHLDDIVILLPYQTAKGNTCTQVTE